MSLDFCDPVTIQGGLFFSKGHQLKFNDQTHMSSNKLLKSFSGFEPVIHESVTAHIKYFITVS